MKIKRSLGVGIIFGIVLASFLTGLLIVYGRQQLQLQTARTYFSNVSSLAQLQDSIEEINASTQVTTKLNSIEQPTVPTDPTSAAINLKSLNITLSSGSIEDINQYLNKLISDLNAITPPIEIKAEVDELKVALDEYERLLLPYNEASTYYNRLGKAFSNIDYNKYIVTSASSYTDIQVAMLGMSVEYTNLAGSLSAISAPPNMSTFHNTLIQDFKNFSQYFRDFSDVYAKVGPALELSKNPSPSTQELNAINEALAALNNLPKLPEMQITKINVEELPPVDSAKLADITTRITNATIEIQKYKQELGI